LGLGYNEPGWPWREADAARGTIDDRKATGLRIVYWASCVRRASLGPTGLVVNRRGSLRASVPQW